MLFTKPTYILLALLTAFAWSDLQAQKRNLKFEHIGTKQGLSHSNVACIHEDSRGFLWFGGRDGLNKYNGYTFTVYKNDPRDPSTISHNTVTSIREDDNGNLWIGTWGGGLNYFDRKKEAFVRYKHDEKNVNSISSNQIHTLEMDHLGNLWIGLENGGLDHFNIAERRFSHYSHDEKDVRSITNNYVKWVLEDSDRNLWVGTLQGLNQLDRTSNTFVHYRHDPQDITTITSDNIMCLYEDKLGNLWIGTDRGLSLFNKKTKSFRRFQHDKEDPSSIIGSRIFAIAEDDQGFLWVGVENAGLSVLDTRTMQFSNYAPLPTDPMSLNSSSIWSLYCDKLGNMWVGTFNGGINVVKKSATKFNHYRHIPGENSLSSDKVLSIMEDRTAMLWIGTDGGGVNIFNPTTKSFTHLRHEKNNSNTLAGDYVLKVYEDSHGNIWVGTWGNGLTFIDRKTNQYTHYKHDPNDPNSLSNDNCWEILEDSDGTIWIGTFFGGLNKFNTETHTFTRYTAEANSPTSLSSNRIFSLEEDVYGNLLIGTDGGGLSVMNKKTGSFTTYKNNESGKSLGGNSVFCTLEDTLKNLWIGTDEGLTYYDRDAGTFTNFTIEDGLPNNMIFGMLDDGKGNLWLSTNKGLSKFNVGARTFKNYTSIDGLQGDEFKEEARCKSRSGAMYFGGNNGFNEFFPDSVREIQYDPPVVFTDFQIFNEPVQIADNLHPDSPLQSAISETREIVLSHKESVISFEFASLHYTDEQNKRYAYKLEGFDKNWNNVGTKRTATYTNLEPGKYTLKVRGLNNQGEWSEKEAMINITIVPPFWKTWWFKVMAILASSALVVSFYSARIDRIRKQKEILEAEVQERTAALSRSTLELKKTNEDLDKFAYVVSHDLKAPLRAIDNLSKWIAEDAIAGNSDGVQKNTKLMEDRVERMHRLIDGILQYSKIGKAASEKEAIDTKALIRDIAHIIALPTDFKLIIGDGLPVIQHNRVWLEQIFTNLISNAVKYHHKDAGNISVGYKDLGEFHQFSVTDDGPGIAPEHHEKVFVIFQTLHSKDRKDSTGVGLAIVKKIIEENGGTIWIESDGFSGTTFLFTLKK